MPRPGRLPDPRAIHRNPLAEWTEVPEVPFDYVAAGRTLEPMAGYTWHERTVKWFEVVAALPHAALWRDGDWIALFDLALLKEKQYDGTASVSTIAEIRMREGHFATTEEARYKARIRYITPTASSIAPAAPADPAADDVSDLPDDVPDISSARDRARRRRAV